MMAYLKAAYRRLLEQVDVLIDPESLTMEYQYCRVTEGDDHD